MTGRRLASRVHVTDDQHGTHTFEAGAEVPAWAAERITNPKAWESDEDSEPGTPPPVPAAEPEPVPVSEPVAEPLPDAEPEPEPDEAAEAPALATRRAGGRRKAGADAPVLGD
ncbi:hypothetical protein [Kitasatospora sp. MBT66]|uniref:hypothetical protein n=1 Tax=Kitasatospora sp. MBT66 TaxID=1444769 RepID=UPI00068E7AA0|nr:hypothetical protein [Kitasatospora sp. MBT66]